MMIIEYETTIPHIKNLEIIKNYTLNIKPVISKLNKQNKIINLIH